MGNNDVKIEWNPAALSDEPEQHAFFFEQWFQRLGRNRDFYDLNKVKGTFMEGAYYRADYTDRISVLALNTLYWNRNDDTKDQGPAPENQMKWLED